MCVHIGTHAYIYINKHAEKYLLKRFISRNLLPQLWILTCGAQWQEGQAGNSWVGVDTAVQRWNFFFSEKP